MRAGGLFEGFSSTGTIASIVRIPRAFSVGQGGHPANATPWLE
jgi:hypothetical protein